MTKGNRSIKAKKANISRTSKENKFFFYIKQHFDFLTFLKEKGIYFIGAILIAGIRL